jgi:3',5'-cyclic AMP phosphodiesterase CpdA
MPTLLHASDLHFGKAFSPEAAGALRAALAALAPDLVVLSGDFTQRAKIGEYRQAREFLDGLTGTPVVVTPGNHDVPLYRVWERMLAPRRNYRRHITPELDTVTRVEGVTAVALDSSAPYQAIVNGRLLDRQLRFAAAGFAGAPAGDLRVLVTHHNLMPAPDFGPYQVLPGFQRALQALAGMGVDLVLAGHLHRGWVGTAGDVYPGGSGSRRVILAHSGTTTSRRGRAGEEGANSLNLVRVDADRVEITRYRRPLQGGGFEPECSHVFPRMKGNAP